MSDRKKAPLYKSFSYAFEGIFTCIRKERNIKIHCVFMFLVIAAGLVLHLSVTEWCICLVGTCQYSGGICGGSGHRGEKASGQGRQRYGGRGGSHIRHHGGYHRMCDFCSKGS